MYIQNCVWVFVLFETGSHCSPGWPGVLGEPVAHQASVVLDYRLEPPNPSSEFVWLGPQQVWSPEVMIELTKSLWCMPLFSHPHFSRRKTIIKYLVSAGILVFRSESFGL